MPHYRSMFDSQYLFAFDLQGKDRHVQIERVAAGELVGGGGRKTKKPLVFFKGVEKPLALNSTNAKAIVAISGSPDTDKWVGQWITLYPTQCQSPTGETTDCIRVKPKAPQIPTQSKPSEAS
jgi:hypothetical protein